MAADKVKVKLKTSRVDYAAKSDGRIPNLGDKSSIFALIKEFSLIPGITISYLRLCSSEEF